MARVAFDTLYKGKTTDDKTGDIEGQEKRFLDVCAAAGVTDVDRQSPVSAEAEGELLVRLIDRLNASHVPYAVEEQSQRADDDSMPA